MLSRMAPSSPLAMRTLHLLKTPDILCANDMPKNGGNYFVILEQYGVITSLLPALPHDYFPGPWTAAPERITVGHKTRCLCQTGRMEATIVALRPATRATTVNESGGCPT